MRDPNNRDFQAGSGAKHLALLALDDFLNVFDALAVVRLGAALGANLGRELSDRLVAWSADREHIALDGKDHALRRRHDDWVGVSDIELQILPGGLGPPAHTDDFELLLVSLGHAGDHALDARPRRAPQGAHKLLFQPVLINRDFDGVLALIPHHGHFGAIAERQLALGTFDVHDPRLRIKVHLDARGDDDWLFSDAGHGGNSECED